jgi:protein-S-isoprenylcysteine O-methyltransferase Ste14
MRRLVAILYGAACHGTFLVAVSAMTVGLFCGLSSGLGRLQGPQAILANSLLVLQFPLLHSWLLTRPGRRALAACAPARLGSTLTPTAFAFCAALQIGATFLLWSPSHIVLWAPSGAAFALHLAAFVAAWAFLGKALFDAGLGLQTGSIGWIAAWKGVRPNFPPLPERGLFAACRQPIYLGFALVLWTGPTWTPDHLALALAWSLYCLVGPLHKERRFLATYGEDFQRYRARTPYLLPRIF